MRTKILLLILLVFCPLVKSQDFNITPYLMKIEKGEADSVRIELENLKIKYPDDPNILFLDAVLTIDALSASAKFIKITRDYPNSKYADASVYRLFNYYTVEGDFETANSYFVKLKNDYPESPYLKIAQTQTGALTELNKSEKEIPKTEIRKVSSYSYSIQAGAFTKRENAQSLKSQFEKAGIFSEIKEKNVAGTIFNVVYAGKFENREDAENFLFIINSQFKLQGRVIEINK